MPALLTRSRVLCLVLALLASTAQAATSVIVELRDDAAAMAAAKARAKGTPMSAAQIEAYRSTLSTAQTQLLQKLGANGIAYELGGITVNNVRIDFRYTLVFNGIAMKVDPSAIARIEAMPEVKRVHPDTIKYTSLDVSVPYIRAPQVYGAIKELTRFDTAREGFEGQGINISVIDSGVEWHHEMFGGDPTPPRLGVAPATASGTNEKIIYYLPLSDVVVEDGLGHGTHVASTAAGYQGFTPGPDGIPLNADDIKIHGVAPQARLMSYKVCSDAVSIPGALTGAVGGCVTSVITMGIEDSVSPRTVNGFPKPVANVINMSLGGSGGPDDVTSVASDNAARLGVIVVAAAGNSGPGEATTGAPCAGRLVVCVANSIDPAGSWSFDVLSPTSVNRLLPGAVKPAASLPVASNQRRGIQLVPMAGTPDPPPGAMAQYYVYVAGGETPAAYPASVAGRIAIVGAGTLPATFAQITNSAASAGAVAVILRSATANPTAVKSTIPGANLVPADFDYLVSIMNAGTTPANGTLSVYPIRLNSFFGATTMNSSSSRGPVEGFGQVKPDVTAPGTNIMAAMPPASLLGVLAQGNYGAISGTSMASPHVAGAAALVKQAHMTWSPEMVRTALMNTATNLRNELGAAKADSTTAEQVIDQGGGLIDVYAAVNTRALLGVTSNDPALPSILGSYSFGEVPAINAHAVVSRTVAVTLRDVAGRSGNYSISVVNNRGLELSGISVSAPSSVAVNAGSDATFNVTASIDGSVITTGDPLQLQWYVRATPVEGGATLSMPFYLRATRVFPPPATMNAVADDATPDRENGIDRDGRFNLSWSYPSNAAVPCGYRVEETQPTASGTIWLDDAEELMLDAGNSKWDSATGWTTRPHPNTLSLGYGAVYTDNANATITSKTAIALPPALITLTFESFEDLEVDFDYGHVDVSDDGGASWRELSTYNGAFSGVRSVDLSPFAGKAVKLRFRLVSDGGVSMPAYQGWWIDDIRIQAGASFNAIATLPSSTTSLAIGGKQDGTYAYRVVALFDNCISNPFATTPSNIEQVTVQISTRPPMAVFTSSANPSESAQSVTFNASASADQDQVGSNPGIASYNWSFGDGATATTAVATHAYTSPGTYRVALTVVDEEGESASTESLQTVHDPNANVFGGGSVNYIDFGVNASNLGDTANGDFTWNDLDAGLDFESVRITRVERTSNKATIYGDCTKNKTQTVPCVLTLIDRGAYGDIANLDAGNYSGGGIVNDGNVTVQP